MGFGRLRCRRVEPALHPRGGRFGVEVWFGGRRGRARAERATQLAFDDVVPSALLIHCSDLSKP